MHFLYCKTNQHLAGQALWYWGDEKDFTGDEKYSEVLIGDQMHFLYCKANQADENARVNFAYLYVSAPSKFCQERMIAKMIHMGIVGWDETSKSFALLLN